MSKSTRGARVAGIAGLAVSLSVGVVAPAFAVPTFEFTRVGGEDRYETAADVADVYGAKPDAIIANGQPGKYADALASNYLSKVKDAPILLTRLKGLPGHTLDQLKQMGAKNVWVVGGEAVVPASQVAQLQAAGYTVTRIAGADRYETDAKVIAENGASTGGVGLIATGQNFPDALAAGPFAYQGHSLGLTRTNSLPDVVGDALQADGVKEVLIFGGTDAVGPAVVSDLAARGITVKARFAGADRSETSELAAEWALANLSFTNKHLGVASGYPRGFGADALAGGPLEGKEKAPMLITRSESNPDDVLDYLKNHCQTLENGHLFGGTVAITQAAEDAMEAAAKCATPGNRQVTSRPELVSAAIVQTTSQGTTVRYTFDEALSGSSVQGNANDFHVYPFGYSNDDPDADGAPGYSGDSIQVDAANTRSVLVTFQDINSSTVAGTLSVATVDEDAARGLENNAGDGNAIGDAPLNAGSTSTLTSGITAAPDLVSVGNFRSNPANPLQTLVDFTFDENAWNESGNDGYWLVATNGEDEAQGRIISGNGTATHTVEFLNADLSGATTTITAASIARGFVEAGAVDDNATGTAGNANALQAADVSQSGNSETPDLVSAEIRRDVAISGVGTRDQILYTFDEPVLVDGANTDFQAYLSTGQEIAGQASPAPTRSSTNDTQVLVTFAQDSLDLAVGANVLEGAVIEGTGTQSRPNLEDEVGATGVGSGPTTTSGRTNAPDLTGVAVTRRTDAFGTTIGARVTYTFDEDVFGPQAGDFVIYLADGARYTCSGTPAVGTTEDTDNQVTCDTFGTATTSQILSAVLGAVDDSAVQGQAANTGPGTATPGGAGNGELNPEGSEVATPPAA